MYWLFHSRSFQPFWNGCLNQLINNAEWPPELMSTGTFPTGTYKHSSCYITLQK